MQKVCAGSLDPDDLGAWHDLLHHGGDPREERGAAGDHEDGVEILGATPPLDGRADLPHHLEPRRGVPRDHQRVVVRRDQRELTLHLRQALCLRLRLGEGGAVNEDGGAGALDGLAPLHRSALGHHDRRLHLQRGGRLGDREAGAADGVGDDLLRGRVVRQHVVRAADLVRERGQKVFSLEEDASLHTLAESACELQGRLSDEVIHARGEGETHVVGLRRVGLEFLAIAERRRLRGHRRRLLLLLQLGERSAYPKGEARHPPPAPVASHARRE
mmetsp:Transcript_47552/g.117741  ORF Transcript_47552/g.117741 Transcript_47552/m.117741 type:complete len:273 (-) Transcript_47552:84-902(-)